MFLYYTQVTHIEKDIGNEIEIILNDKNITEIDVPNTIRKLSLRGNSFLQLPNILHLQLTYLDLSRNIVGPINEIFNITSLTILKLHNMELTNLCGISKLTKLRSLDVSNNLLKCIPIELYTLTKLMNLHISNNEITEIPLEIKNFNILTMLTLANNNITDITPIYEMISLRYLNLNNNPNLNITNDILKLTKLKALLLEKAQYSKEVKDFIDQLKVMLNKRQH